MDREDRFLTAVQEFIGPQNREGLHDEIQNVLTATLYAAKRAGLPIRQLADRAVLMAANADR